MIGSEAGSPVADPFPRGRSLAYTVSGSAAFEKIVQRESLSGSAVLLPAFICQEGFGPIFDRYDLEPVFVDVDEESYHLDRDRATGQLEDVDAALVVHAFGLPARMDWWVEQCRRADVLLIEDCARALGARRDGRLVGGFGDYAIFSLSKVAPVYTGGCLVSAAADDRFELRSSPITADLLVKTAYSALPRGVPYEDRAVSLYKTLVGDREYSLDTTEQDLSADADERTVRRIDPVNRWLFERHLQRAYPRTLEEHRSVATALRRVLERHGFEVQRDDPGRVHYSLPATVSRRRDELVSYLESRGYPVRVIWDDPWGPTHRDSHSGAGFPVASYLADHVVTFPVTELSRSDVDRLARDLRSRSARAATAD